MCATASQYVGACHTIGSLDQSIGAGFIISYGLAGVGAKDPEKTVQIGLQPFPRGKWQDSLGQSLCVSSESV